MKSLVIRPKFDDVTEFSYAWGGDAISILEKVGSEVKDLGGRKITREEVENIISSDNPELIAHYDHGAERAWMGSSEEAVVDMSNVGLLANRIVYTMNCLSAAVLGIEAWRIGTKVYVGYMEEFAFTENDEKLFREAASHGLELYFLEGIQDWKAIKDGMIKKYDEMISATEDEWSQIWLTHDRDALRIWDGEEPTSDCCFRRLALKIFGKRLGWAFPRRMKKNG